MAEGGEKMARTLARHRRTVRAHAFWPTAIAVLTMLALLPALADRLEAVRADEVTISHDLLRTGWDPGEPALTPAAVGGGGFGELFSVPVNGQVYAQPLVVGSSVIVVTENDWVYALDRRTGAVNWSLSLGTPWVPGSICTDLTPNIGVTSTPVYDPSSGTLYLVALTVQGSVPGYSLYGINGQTGAITEQVPIGGSPVNDPGITFAASQQFQRPGLLLMNGWVYAGFGSHCDVKPYDGYVVGVNVATQATTMWSDEAEVTDDEAGIWQGGGGLMSDGPGRIFLVSGNGISPVPGPGTAPPGQLAESVVRLAVQPGGSLAAQDFFSPKNAPTLDAQDLDFGSGGAVGLPFGTPAYSDLLVAAGKYGRIYLLNRDNLGGRDQGPGGSDAALRVICCFGGEWGHPAAFADTPTLTAADSSTANDFLYYDGNTDYLREMRWATDSTGIPNLHTVATSANIFRFTSGSPVVTSNGTDPTSAIVWVIGVTKSTGVGGTLYAYAAVPPASCTSGSPCTINPLWSAPIGTASKFSVPAADGGDVYLGTRDGNVYGFGITAGGPLAGLAPAAFGRRSVGTSVSKIITVRASRRLTVTGVSVSASSVAPADPFTVGQVTETVHGKTRPVSLPARLSRGDLLHAPVTFSPANPGGATGALSFTTGATRLPVISVPLSGDGTQTGLYAIPSAVSFALAPDQGVTSVPVGMTVVSIADITNGGTSPVTVASVTRPAAPFSASRLPARGTVIEPGQSISVQVSYTPTTAGPATGSLTITGDAGTSAIVDLSGTGQPAVSRFTVTHGTVNFGRVPVGTKVTATVGIANTGNQPSVVTGVTPPGRPFGVPFAVPRGLGINPGNDVVVTVVFRPGKPGPATGFYRLSWHDSVGAHQVTIDLAGTGVGLRRRACGSCPRTNAAPAGSRPS
jgi:outer membrane protein assembly factor BamB